MSEEASVDRASQGMGCATLPMFGGGCLAWVMLLGLATVGVMLGTADLSNPAALMESNATVRITAVATIVQTGGLAVLGALLLAIPPRRSTEPESVATRVAGRMALRGASPVWFFAAGVGGLFIGMPAGWLATTLNELFPNLSVGGLEMIGDMLQTEDPVGRALFFVAVSGSAPLFEELVFRSFMYRAFKDGALAALAAVKPTTRMRLASLVALLGSTALFAAYHMDPLHVLALLPTAVFLGVLRWGSGSVWPAVLAHFVNNTLAIVASTVLAEQFEPVEGSALLAIIGLTVTTVLAGLAWVVSPPPTDQDL